MRRLAIADTWCSVWQCVLSTEWARWSQSPRCIIIGGAFAQTRFLDLLFLDGLAECPGYHVPCHRRRHSQSLRLDKWGVFWSTTGRICLMFEKCPNQLGCIARIFSEHNSPACSCRDFEDFRRAIPGGMVAMYSAIIKIHAGLLSLFNYTSTCMKKRLLFLRLPRRTHKVEPWKSLQFHWSEQVNWSGLMYLGSM